MQNIRANIRKLLPSLAIGIFLTVLAAWFNYLVYERRLPAMAAGNLIFDSSPESGFTRRKVDERAAQRLFRILAGVVNRSDDFISDLMFALRGPGDFPSTKNDLVVVAIDSESIQRRGAWPWPRSDVAELLRAVAPARVVGMDLMMSEPDRTSLANYASRFNQLFDVDIDVAKVNPEIMDNDLRLAREISTINTVLGVVLYDGEIPGARDESLIANYSLRVASPRKEEVPTAKVLLRQADRALTDLPIIRNFTPPPLGEGFVNLFPAPNGAVRDVPLFAHILHGDGKTMTARPSLILEMMRVYLGGDGYRLNLRGDVVNIPEFRTQGDSGDRYAVKSVTITRAGPSENEELLTIPLDELGEMEMGYTDHREDYHIVPAWEVLEGKHRDTFKDKLVVIGGTVETVGYTVPTGFADPNIPAPRAHASILSSMLKRDFMDTGYQDDYFWQQMTILASGLMVTLAIIFGNLGIGMAVSGMTILGILFGNYFLFFRHGMDVGITLPLLSTLAVLAALLVANYLIVGRERRFIRRAFALNVSPSILGYLESHPDRLSSLSGEHRDMTVLFTDIRGFTAISERMTAPDLARFLNDYFTPMSDIVMKNMGTVDKFIGDALMAFWNAPADNPHHARDAARSALEMVNRLADLQTGWTSRGLPRVAIGIGINSGMMFAGQMGSEQRKNYTVLGDNVNIASRLEELNKIYSTSILISESTLRELNNEFVCRVVDKVRVSGKMSSVVIYELLGAGPGTDEECEEIAAFTRVFELYQMREFATAETLLKELVFIRPTPLYRMYLDRLAIYKALPPPADWDGTFAMRQK